MNQSELIQKVLANEDLKRLVYSFGSIDNRRLMRQVRYKINFDILDTRLDTEGLLTKVIRNFIYTKWDHEYIEEMDLRETFMNFYRFRSCRCCSRHSHNKPNIRMKGKQLLFLREEIQVPECKNLNHCHCYCRKETRHLWSMIRYRCRASSVSSESDPDN